MITLCKFIHIHSIFQSGWSIPVDIVIGTLTQGIAYMTDSAVTVRGNLEDVFCFIVYRDRRQDVAHEMESN